jgi:hypothetical protein
MGAINTKFFSPQGAAFKAPITPSMKGSPEGFFSAFSYLWKKGDGEAMARICLKLPILRPQECIVPLWGPESTNTRKEVTTYELTRSIG